MVFRMRNNIAEGISSRRSRGFSLIEAVVVISLLGIIAAFALPRFTHLANDARASEVVALSAYLQNAAQTARARFLASGSRLSSTTIEGRTVILKNGYPDSSTTGIRNALFDSDGFTANEGNDSVTFTRADAPSGAACSVTYRVAEQGSNAATITTIDTSGC
jgi:MSHA pilin protein MshA